MGEKIGSFEQLWALAQLRNPVTLYFPYQSVIFKRTFTLDKSRDRYLRVNSDQVEGYWAGNFNYSVPGYTNYWEAYAAHRLKQTGESS